MNQDSTLRRMFPLDHGWRFAPDMYDLGEKEGFADPAFDDTAWRPTCLPACADRLFPEMDGYRGACWFRRRFRSPAGKTERLRLHIGAVAGRLAVSLDGICIHRSRDSFLPVELDLPEDGDAEREHLLTLRVDNTSFPDDIPGPRLGWEMPCGVLRPVVLEVVPSVMLAECWHETSPEGDAALIRLHIRLLHPEGLPEGMNIVWQVTGPDGQPCGSETVIALAPTVDNVSTMSCERRMDAPALWSPETPSLHAAHVILRHGDTPVDDLRQRFGIRALTTRGTELVLNGTPIILRGFNRHEDSPLHGMTPDPATTRSDLLAMKGLGCNFIRLAHYPHDPSTLDLCDELGLLVMAEVPVYWWGGQDDAQSESILAAGLRQLEAMIRRDRHHPSIAFWSVSNETNESLEHVRRGNRLLAEHARTLDPTRLVTHVSTIGHVNAETSVADDVICVNDYPGVVASRNGTWDPDAVARAWTDQILDLHRLYPDRPIFATEFGYPAFAGMADGVHGEPRQAECLEAEFRGIEAGGVCGTVVWCWADHPWPKGFEKPQITRSTYGVLTRDRVPKAALATIRRLFGKTEAPLQ